MNSLSIYKPLIHISLNLVHKKIIKEKNKNNHLYLVV